MMTIYPWAALGRPLSPDEQAIAERLQADTAFRRQLMRMRRDGLGYFTPACGMDQPAAVEFRAPLRLRQREASASRRCRTSETRRPAGPMGRG